MTFDIDTVRADFPALAVRDGGRARIYFDAPGGTQICRSAISRMVAHMESGTANSGGPFVTSVATDALSRSAHEAMADLVGGTADEIAFGQNMTTLTLSVSRALGRRWREGDEILVTRLDHDANVAPWLLLARDRRLVVRWLDFNLEDGRLDLDALPKLLSRRTRLVAVGGASNALGTINNVAAIVRTVRAHSNALVFVDAVQSVPHIPVDVRAIGCDLLACSPYKFFGPHRASCGAAPTSCPKSRLTNCARRQRSRPPFALRPVRLRSKAWRARWGLLSIWLPWEARQVTAARAFAPE